MLDALAQRINKLLELLSKSYVLLILSFWKEKIDVIWETEVLSRDSSEFEFWLLKKTSENARILSISRALYHYWINNLQGTNRKQNPSLCRGKKTANTMFDLIFSVGTAFICCQSCWYSQRTTVYSVLVFTEILHVSNMGRASPSTSLDYQKHLLLCQSWRCKMRSAELSSSAPGVTASSISTATEGCKHLGGTRAAAGGQGTPEPPSRSSTGVLMPIHLCSRLTTLPSHRPPASAPKRNCSQAQQHPHPPIPRDVCNCKHKMLSEASSLKTNKNPQGSNKWTSYAKENNLSDKLKHL